MIAAVQRNIPVAVAHRCRPLLAAHRPAPTLLPCPQIALAAAVSGVVGHYLDGEFELDDYNHTTSCGLSMRGASVCTAAYLSTVASILLSVFIIAMQVDAC